jgi:hypothetical protein
MSLGNLTQLVIILMATPLLAGCRQGSPPDGDRFAPDGPWVYQSKEFGFSLTLPSPRWKESTRKNRLLDFSSSFLSSPMLASVVNVEVQTIEEFQQAVKAFRDGLKKHKDFLKEPVHQQGTTKSGNAYAYTTLCEKGNADSRFFYVACSHTWIKDKGITVQVLFEGQGTMRSRVFKSAEYSHFEKAARTICLSVK